MNLVSIFIIGTCLLQLSTLLTAIEVECVFETSDFSYVGKVYECFFLGKPIITSRQSAVIDSVKGSHDTEKDDDSVIGILATSKTIHCFPRNIDKIFKNIKSIMMHKCQLKEIHQSDLKVFPKLESLNLENNDLKVLEKGLFDFNPVLGAIYINENKLVHIDLNVFDHLDKLAWYYMVDNPCTNPDIYALDNVNYAKRAVNQTKSICKNQTYLTIEKNLEELEENLNDKTSVVFPNFNEKLKDVESQISTSEFPDFFDARIANINDEWKIRQ